jgi:parallel beta-helix repeat protein
MSNTTLRFVMALLALMLAVMGQTLWATQVQVNASGQSCMNRPLPVYTTIQAAVSAVSSNGTVFVCPGTYPEQILISQPLTLEGVDSGNSGAAVVIPPAGGLKTLPGTGTFPQIFANNIPSGKVTISNLTLDATNNGVGCNIMEAIYFKDTSGTIEHVAARNQSICGNSLVLRVVGLVNNSVVTLANNSVRGYAGVESTAIIAQGALASVIVQKNELWGPGPNNGQTIGIWMLDGATGTISGNSIVDNSGLSPAASAGILIQGSHGVTISKNTVGNNAYGIQFFPDPGFDADDGNVTKNTILGSSLDGVYACSSGNIIQNNTISSSIESAVNLPSVSGSCGGNGNMVTNNTINEACAGILMDPSVTGNVTTPNTIFNATALQLTGASCPALARPASVRVPPELSR